MAEDKDLDYMLGLNVEKENSIGSNAQSDTFRKFIKKKDADSENLDYTSSSINTGMLNQVNI